MSLQTITQANLDQFLSTKVAVLDFSATWCGPCRQLKPTITQIASDYNGKVNVGMLDIDQNRDVALRYGVTAVPTLMFFKDGKPVAQMQGAQPGEKIAQVIEELISGQ